MAHVLDLAARLRPFYLRSRASAATYSLLHEPSIY